MGSQESSLKKIDFWSQLIRIDAVRFVLNSDLVLFHLSKEPNQTQFVRPISIPYVFRSDSETDVCVAVGDETIFLHISENCPSDRICYNRTVPLYQNCKSKPWIGVIVCQSQWGWYPSSPFFEEKGICGFENSKFTAIHQKISDINQILGLFAFCTKFFHTFFTYHVTLQYCC